MIIKAGFDGKPTTIRISTRDNNGRMAELWIKQEGVIDGSNPARTSETLAYVTLNELLDLQDELKRAIQDMVK